ncbi:UDP-GlcNAc:undecaprenylphosphate GlcNAc-1-phosphate transferase [Vibrio nigripulchritudo MADA3029]|uniref:UDP-N-acetylglucosamine--undecaprenyl-phosphate N-acetylglucosaminephosphotransferase n=1 Tax=Vibrio nigripulchritudo TaxID=28173 RepID=UPI0003B1957A|nr:UDP-N-acetylglucosamine--undecaprenyl-phosphate N-acetylglucosaminephosphotransferase [Vibrio nigripulchritudo]CCN47631.1 UDP-GlcNAc:undecaprenylphosphate GlcNAc-1-phosphate transferase [Vibrio nigripulchritudo MADA3020]CCN56546.1 UDP-GlcNAc:undecaprenylphosphate GlcNAc-1-phosphate transferase [Vibrio nigripulchritudo MADA3021]CCN58830.1 UDP-GlcNAc:undecaprenylphosphate GlcNAc-1-phosphate transferase [Vibrio nigripulchritudo MADA3029]
MLLELIFIFFSSFATLFLMRKVAKHIGLVDTPNLRKLHTGAVPLVGGISVCITLSHFILLKPDIIRNSELFLACITFLTLLGALDDKFDISFKIRILCQALVSIVMIKLGGHSLYFLGDMFGVGSIIFESSWLSISITTLAVIGAINAFNMVDGIDGLLGGLSIVTFSAIAILLNIDAQRDLAYLCVVIVVAMIPYICMNLGLLGRKRKVFMGDAGSMLIGFSVIWILLSASQISRESNDALMRPVTALWLITVPLMDMAAIMIRRIRRGHSPFKPDREHLHHIFQRLGLGPKQTLTIICIIATIFAGIGIYGEIKNIPEVIMFSLFIGLFLIYTIVLSYIWKIIKFIRSRMGDDPNVQNV